VDVSRKTGQQNLSRPPNPVNCIDDPAETKLNGSRSIPDYSSIRLNCKQDGSRIVSAFDSVKRWKD
jgi:hypothetical protein